MQHLGGYVAYGARDTNFCNRASIISFISECPEQNYKNNKLMLYLTTKKYMDTMDFCNGRNKMLANSSERAHEKRFKRRRT